MDLTIPRAGQIGADRLTRQLGEWRRRGPRKASSDLAEAVRMLVLDGRLAAGTGLPAERELARALNASRTMIAAALEQLRQAGFVASRRGSGSWITLPGKGMSTPVELEARSRMLDLAHAALPAPRELVAAVDAARAQLPAYLSDHGYHQRGLAVLRQRVARHYERRGLPTAQDQIVITSGAQHAFALVLMLLAGPGDRVVVEQPTYPNTLNAIRAARALPVPVAMTDEGWDLDALDAALRQSAPRLAFLQPDFQNPTGLRMDAGDRRRLVTVLRKNRVPAVIDETTVELDLEGDPLDGPPPTASYGDDAVISIGSASKAYWGGLRLGWIRSPLELVHRLVSARSAIDLGTPVFEQLVLAELLADPEPLLRRRRLEVVERRDALAAAIGEHCPGWTFRNPAGGLCLWCRLDAPVSTRIAVVAEHFGVRVAPGSSFAVYGGLERWLRLPYTQPVEALRDAAQRLSSALSAIGDAEHSSIVDDIIPVA